MEQSKQCGNCRYFSQYYVKLEHRFMSVYSGRCKLKAMNSKALSSNETACEKWETAEIEIQHRKKTVREAIIDISEKLDRIAEVLFDEEI